MARNNEFHDYVVYDLMEHIPGISSRPMFGGHGLYLDGQIFGLITGGVLYFKVDETNRKKFDELGSAPFTFEKKGGTAVSLSYYEVPESIMNDRDALLKWVTASADITVRAQMSLSQKAKK
jgi:DNA transformation protein